MQFSSVRRLVLAAFSFLAAGAVLWAADPSAADGKGDLLDQARGREQLARQKAEADFRAALREMNKLENAHPARAAERYKTMLAVLDADTVLKPETRAAWQRVLTDRIRIAEAEASRAARATTDEVNHQAAKDDRRAGQDHKAVEDEKLRRDLNTVRRLQADGRSDEAQRLANDIAERHPDSPAATAARQITGVAAAVRENEAIKRERNNRWVLAMREVEKSAMPAINEIEFPSPEKWREITKRRTKSQATEAEKAILKALDSPISVNFEGSTFEAAIDYLQTLSGVTIIVDKKTLEDAGYSYDTPINVKMRRVSLRTVLRKVLGEVGLTYIVEKETIHVVTPKEARERMTVRTYYLGDLAGVTDMTLGPVFTAAAMQQTVAALIQTIVGTVEPDSWQMNNPEARGTIFFDPRTLTLIVKQSAEVHYLLGGLGR